MDLPYHAAFFFAGGEGRGGRLGHLFAVVWSSIVKCIEVLFHACYVLGSGADPGLFLGGGALVSCSTSTPINLIVFFFSAEYQLYQKTAGHLRGGAHPLHPPPRSAPVGKENRSLFLGLCYVISRLHFISQIIQPFLSDVHRQC